MSARHPPIAELVPHSGSMRLLDRVLGHSPHHTVCAVDVAKSELFREADGSVPAWVGIEYMAQCAAVHGGLLARERGGTPGPALLLGSRRMAIRVDGFDVGQSLEVSARHARGDSRLVIFDCEVRDSGSGEVLLEGRLNVYSVPEGELEHAAEGDPADG